MISAPMTATEAGRVAVLMGGPSAEHDISLKTGRAVLGALQRNGVDAAAVVWDGDLTAPLTTAPGFDRAFVALHGRGGEDGIVQGFLELLGMPYSGSGVLASALAMDKARSKAIWRASGIPTPDSMTVTPDTDPGTGVAQLGLPLFVKPARDGSSFGISRVMDADALGAAIALASRYDRRVLVERAITGREYTVGILDGEALPAILLETDREFYDYEAKYVGSQTRYVIPCGLGPDEESEIARLAVAAFAELGAHGWGRVDLMVDGEGRPFLLELNTVPGLTDHSLVPMAARAAGIGFDELVMRILGTSRTERGLS